VVKRLTRRCRRKANMYRGTTRPGNSSIRLIKIPTSARRRRDRSLTRGTFSARKFTVSFRERNFGFGRTAKILRVVCTRERIIGWIQHLFTVSALCRRNHTTQLIVDAQMPWRGLRTPLPLKKNNYVTTFY
jgi:hypothetical protein